MAMTTQEATHSHSIQSSRPLAGAYFWLLAFFVVYCARPEDWIPWLYVIPLAKITGVFAVAAFALSLGQARRLPREVLYLFLIFVQLCLAAAFSPVWRGGAFNSVLEFSKVVVIVPVVALAVTTLPRLRWLIFTQTASVLAVATVSLVKGQLRGERLAGVLGGIYGNANDLALAIVLTIPFCFAFMLKTCSGFRKAAWFLAATVMIYALFLTGSRGGLLALVVTVGVILKEFAVKAGRRHLVVLAGLVVFAVMLLAGGGLKKRFDAMSRGSVKSAEDIEAYGSAVTRRGLLWRSLVVTAQNPLFGVGPGNFAVLSGDWHVAHNSFTELSAEGGLPALILFILFFRRAFYNLRNAELLAPGPSEQVLLAGALRASLVGFAVGAFFASVEYHFFPYFLVAYTTAFHAIATKNAAQEGPRQRIAPAPLQPQDRREPGGSTVTWADYQKGRAI
jgi:O-antigen ligase